MLGDSDGNDDPDPVAVQTSSAVDEEQGEDEEGEREGTEEEEPPSEELIGNIMRKLWRFNDCYTIANMVSIECVEIYFILI